MVLFVGIESTTSCSSASQMSTLYKTGALPLCKNSVGIGVADGQRLLPNWYFITGL